MTFKWLDILDIAIELNDTYSDVDPKWISFPDLHQKICSLKSFDDDPVASNERILEAIQAAWMDEFD